jgi:hypothetical protein
MSNQDQIIQTNNPYNASQSSCAELYAKPSTQARTQQPLKKVKALEDKASTSSPLQTQPAWLLQAVSRIATIFELTKCTAEDKSFPLIFEYLSLSTRVSGLLGCLKFN